jgi:hypothetical protein
MLYICVRPYSGPEYRGRTVWNSGRKNKKKKQKLDDLPPAQMQEETVSQGKEKPALLQVQLKSIQDILLQNGTFFFTEHMAFLLSHESERNIMYSMYLSNALQ